MSNYFNCYKVGFGILMSFLIIVTVVFGQKPAAAPIQLKLKQVAITREAQPFSGELTVVSGRLEPVVRSATPSQGEVFWLIKVEFINLSKTDIEIEGSKISARTAEGETIALWGLLGGKAYIPQIGTWSLKGRKKQTEKYLAVVTEDIKRLEFIYEGADSLLISVGNDSAEALQSQSEEIEMQSNTVADEEREKKIIKALKLFGKNAYGTPGNPGVFEINTIVATTKSDSMIAEQMRGIVDKILFHEAHDAAKQFPKAAKLLAKENFIGQIRLPIYKSKQLEFTQIQTILGQEDSVESSTIVGAFASGSINIMTGAFTKTRSTFTVVSVKWYKYGWCWFGVKEDGKAAFLLADCKANRPME